MATLFKQVLPATLAYWNLLISHMVLFRIYNHIFACLLICCLLLKLECRPHEGGFSQASSKGSAWYGLLEPICCFDEQIMLTLRWWQKWEQSKGPSAPRGSCSIDRLHYDLRPGMKQWIIPCVDRGHFSGLISKTGQPNEATGPHTSPKAKAHKHHYSSTLE